MTKTRFSIPAAVFLILKKDDHVLLMRRQNTGWHDGDFDFVAGHIDGGESLITALAREAKEEMGIDIDPASAKFVHLVHAYFAEDGKEYFNIFFTVESWAGEPKIMETDKCDEFGWFKLDQLPQNLTPSARIGLKALVSKESYAEFGFSQPA